jgi:hypothetical protein
MALEPECDPHLPFCQPVLCQIRIDFGRQDPEPLWECGPGSRRAKLEKFRNLKSVQCSLLKDEGFSCSLDVLHRGLGKKKLHFLFKNRFFNLQNFSILRSSNPGFGSALTLNAGSGSALKPVLDPQHCVVAMHGV